MKTVRHKFIIYPSTTSKNACYDYNRNYLEHTARAQNEDNQPYVHAREKGYNQVKKNLVSDLMFYSRLRTRLFWLKKVAVIKPVGPQGPESISPLVLSFNKFLSIVDLIYKLCANILKEMAATGMKMPALIIIAFSENKWINLGKHNRIWKRGEEREENARLQTPAMKTPLASRERSAWLARLVQYYWHVLIKLLGVIINLLWIILKVIFKTDLSYLLSLVFVSLSLVFVHVLFSCFDLLFLLVLEFMLSSWIYLLPH